MSVQDDFDKRIAELLGQARRSTVRDMTLREHRPGTVNTAEEVMEHAWFAEPELDFWPVPDGPFCRLSVVGRRGRVYSRCVVLGDDTPLNVRAKARELREQLDKAAAR